MYILAIDQGTTSSRSLIVDQEGNITATAQKEFEQIYPQSGWVEHDAIQIWETQWQTIQDVIQKAKITPEQISAIGITNQRETTVIWDKKTGKPLHHAIVWQDRRTTDYCRSLVAVGHKEMIKEKTGLVVDSYFSGTKIKWILDRYPDVDRDDLAFGTIDTWLLWKLTEGRQHATDHTNASRTMLYNIKTTEWDQDLLDLLGISTTLLPEVKPSQADFGYTNLLGPSIPILGIAGDQQAALFGQTCFEPGEAKNTYGTGCFMLMHTGSKLQYSDHGLLTTMACSLDGQPQYALEGSVFIAGAAIQWLRDGLQIINSAAESEALAMSVADKHEVFCVPTFSGLGTPYWDDTARGMIIGITRDTSRADIVKATLDSLAYQSMDVLHTMEQDSGIRLKALKVDGGATHNNYMMQFQADILQRPVERPVEVESTALGAAYLAGLGAGIWKLDDIRMFRKVDRLFEVQMTSAQANHLKKRWHKAVDHARGWLD